MKFRLSRTNDHQAIKKIIGAIYAEFGLKQQTALFNWPADKVTGLFFLYKFVVAYSEAAEVLGFICFQELSGDFEVIALGVDPSQQGQGCMSGLFKYFVENVCRKDSRVLLEVHEKNQPALAFYEKAGFRVDGLRKNYYPDGAAAMNMSLTRASLE